MGVARRDKRPILGVIPTGQKIPKIESEPSTYYDRKASWRVSRIQLVAPYGWGTLVSTEIEYLRGKLSQFETMTWGEIFGQAKDRNHPISVSKLKCREARRWMEKNMPDQPTLWTLRVSGAERVWGIFSEGAYQIIFWDPRHLIYPTER